MAQKIVKAIATLATRPILLGVVLVPGLVLSPFLSGASVPMSTEEMIAQDIHLNVVPRTADEVRRIAAVTRPTDDFTKAGRYEEMSAGAGTSRVRRSAKAFSQPLRNLDKHQELNFRVGLGMFRKIWVSSPASTKASDGLGPVYNARACRSCHKNDGRGQSPDRPGDPMLSMFLRVSIPGGEEDRIREIEGYIATRPDPNYGFQLQDNALPGLKAEVQVDVHYDYFRMPLSGGESAELRKPRYVFRELGYGALHPDAMLSPRVAPQMIGLGLLEAIPAQDILALADPDDADGDGISGRPNIVWSVEFDRPMLGRFGLKAGNPTVKEQSSAAFFNDIGISTPLHRAAWGECTEAQDKCRRFPHGDGDVRVHEVDDAGLGLATFYSSNLAVPARRDVDDPQVLQGKRVFYQTGCIACHRPAHVTHRLKDRPAHSFQLIWPYTDLLLHDMGPELADNRPEARANGREWRTAPLWGIGLTERVSGKVGYLHDGRARTLLEAVLWHGGEAEAAKQKVVRMPPADRAALIRFLESL